MNKIKWPKPKKNHYKTFGVILKIKKYTKNKNLL